MESSSDILENLKVELPSDPAIIIPGYTSHVFKSSKDFMLVSHKDICTFIYLFTAVKLDGYQQINCMRNTYIKDFYLLAKKNEINAFSGKLMELKTIK